MRIKMSMLLLAIIASLSGGCAARSAHIQKNREVAKATAEAPVEDRIAKLQIVPENETPDEKLVRLRALKIELENLKKKTDRELQASDTPAMRKARKQVERELRRERREERQDHRAYENAGITGCSTDEEFEDILVEPRATGSYSINSHVKVRVTNLEGFKIDSIEDERGFLVSNLCPGGSITLFRARNWAADGDFITFRFVAKGRFPDGTLGLAESQYYTLSAYDWSSGRGQQYYTWGIQLQKIYPRR